VEKKKRGSFSQGAITSRPSWEGHDRFESNSGKKGRLLPDVREMALWLRLRKGGQEVVLMQRRIVLSFENREEGGEKE